jgi:hypothetical protein
MGKISVDAAIREEQRLLREKHAAEVIAIQRHLASNRATEEERARLHRQLEILETKHQSALMALDRQATEEKKARWRHFFSGLESGFDDAMGGILNASMSLNDGWQRILRGMGQVLDQFIIRSVKAWILGENQKEAATVASVMKRVAMESWGAIQTVAVTVWAALKSIMIKAYEAAAAAFKALAGIPYVGPVLAPAAAGALAAVMSFGSKVASAAGGWGRVPYNQFAAIHKDEMVLPAKYANPMRDMLEGGEGSGTSETYNINITALDAKSLNQYLKSNRGAFIRQFQSARRDFAMGDA